MAVQPSVCEGPCRNHSCQKDAMHEGLWQYAILRVHRREREAPSAWNHFKSSASCPMIFGEPVG